MSTPDLTPRPEQTPKRQRRRITHQITGDFDMPYSKKHVAV